MAFDFKSEEDVKLYLHNLWVEYNFGCHKEKNPEVCHLLAEYTETIKKDYQTAVELFKTNCDSKDFMKSCHKYGKYCILGKGLPKEDYATASKYLQKACDLNNAESCLFAGLLLTGNYEGVKQEFDKGFSLIKRACENRFSDACFYLSGMYITGVSDEIEAAKRSQAGQKKMIDTNKLPQANADAGAKLAKDMTKAFEYSLVACELENIEACINVSRMYKLGEGVQANGDLAERFKDLAIKLRQERERGPEIKFQLGT